MKQIIDRMTMQEQGLHWRKSLTSLALVLSVLLGLTGWSTPAMATNQASVNEGLLQQRGCLWYTIQGINVWPQTVANKFGVSLRAFLIANNLRSDRFLHRGKVVCIPSHGMPNPPPGNDDGGQPGSWTAQYWNNPDLSGPPVASSSVSRLNFNWGFGTPDPARIMADNFSARFTRAIYSSGGVYRFYVQHDDGVRVSLDGQPLLDAYGNVGDRLSAFDAYIAPGSHTLAVDYVERGGIARLKLNFWLLYVGTPLPDGSVVPPVAGGPGQPFPCTKPYLNESNLCVEQPYPAKRGSNVSVVWRITTPFVSGEFDKGDGQGFKGPIYAEQRIIIENVTANRTIKLRWNNGSKWLTDQFTIQVVN